MSYISTIDLAILVMTVERDEHLKKAYEIERDLAKHRSGEITESELREKYLSGEIKRSE